MKILTKDEALELLHHERISELAEDYVLVERPAIRQITLEGDKVLFDGIPVFSRADVKSMDFSVYSAQVEEVLVRYLEYAEAQKEVDLATKGEESDWIYKRRNEVAKEMGYEYMYAPSGIKTLIHRLARAEYMNKTYGKEINE